MVIPKSPSRLQCVDNTGPPLALRLSEGLGIALIGSRKFISSVPIRQEVSPRLVSPGHTSLEYQSAPPTVRFLCLVLGLWPRWPDPNSDWIFQEMPETPVVNLCRHYPKDNRKCFWEFRCAPRAYSRRRGRSRCRSVSRKRRPVQPESTLLRLPEFVSRFRFPSKGIAMMGVATLAVVPVAMPPSKLSGAAQLYRAAPVRTAGLGIGHQHKRREADESCAGTECDALWPLT